MAQHAMKMLPPLLGGVNMDVTTVGAVGLMLLRSMLLAVACNGSWSRAPSTAARLTHHQTDDEFMTKLNARKYDVSCDINGALAYGPHASPRSSSSRLERADGARSS
jgi:hypothetical protein